MSFWNHFISTGKVCQTLVVLCGFALAWSTGSAAQTAGSSPHGAGAAAAPSATPITPSTSTTPAASATSASPGLPDYRPDAWLRDAPAASDTPEQRLQIWREANHTVGRLGGHAGHAGADAARAPASNAPSNNAPSQSSPASRGQP